MDFSTSYTQNNIFFLISYTKNNSFNSVFFFFEKYKKAQKIELSAFSKSTFFVPKSQFFECASL